MGSQFRGADGAHSCTGPPQGPDEVLDSLRLQASCWIKGSLITSGCGRMCKVTDLRVESAAPLLEDGPY
jgi:hypothetical protein